MNLKKGTRTIVHKYKLDLACFISSLDESKDLLFKKEFKVLNVMISIFHVFYYESV